MSRIGKAPIPIPNGVEVNIEGAVIGQLRDRRDHFTRRISQRLTSL